MKLSWIGQCCVFIESQDGRTILMDPYQRVIGLRRPEVHANVVVFSHDHIDHFDPSAVSENADVVAGSGSHRAGGFRFRGFQAWHDPKEGLLSGEVTLFQVEIDGYRVLHLSDLGQELDASAIRAFGKVDVLLFPAGEHTTISLLEARALVEAINPRIAIPMAWHLPGLLMPSASLEKVQRVFPDHRNTTWLELSPGQRLPKATEIRFLDPACLAAGVA